MDKMEQIEDSRSFAEVVVHTVLISQAMVLSLLGNSIFCLAFYRKRRLRTITNIYLLSLAIADLTVATFVFPSVLLASGLRRWPFSHGFCQFTGLLTTFWDEFSLFILAITAINRYFCVVKPQRYASLFTRKNSIISISSVWILLCIFYVIFHDVVYIIYKWQPKDLYCRGTYGRWRFHKMFQVALACLNFGSMSMVFSAYGKILLFVRRHNNAVLPSLQGSRNFQGTFRVHEMKAFRVSFAAVFSFCVSWIPAGVLIILEYGFAVSIPSTARSVPFLFASTSAWINPVIYGVMNRAMHREYRILFSVGKKTDSSN